MKTLLKTGALSMLAALLFALAAIFGTTSQNGFVTLLLWFCAAAFAGSALLQIRRHRQSQQKTGNGKGA